MKILWYNIGVRNYKIQIQKQFSEIERIFMAIEKVKKYFSEIGIADRIMVFEDSSATVDLAAAAVGVIGARICKTLSFKKEGGCILVQMAGDGRVDNRKFKDTFNQKAKMLSGDEVLALTGHGVGGVCAFAIDNPNVEIYCDISLKRFDTVFPACGSSNSAIELTCEELFRYSKAIDWVDICKFQEVED